MKAWDPKSKIKQKTEKSSQEPCDDVSCNDFSEQIGCLNEDIIINADISEAEPLGKEASDDFRSHRLKDTDKGGINDLATKKVTDSKASDH